jgi:heme oxygenase-like protein
MQIRSSPATAERFHETVAAQIVAFESARFLKNLTAGTVTMVHFHDILTTIFHQTRSSPYTFAKAAANCSWEHERIKEYLLQHAEEERAHWRWVLDDLRSTGYAGPDPRTTFPHPTCEAYISFNDRIAERMPIARIAIATVLEGIGAHVGASSYARKLLETLGLAPEQASFFLSHGETDKVHAKQLATVIAAEELSPTEWSWMVHSAHIAGIFYRAMYDHDAFA